MLDASTPTRPAALRRKVKGKLLDLLSERRMSELDLEAELGCSPNLLQQCLHDLRTLEKIHLTGHHSLPDSAKLFRVYALGPVPHVADSFESHCRFYFTHWPRGQARRDPLVAALFGTTAQG